MCYRLVLENIPLLDVRQLFTWQSNSFGKLSLLVGGYDEVLRFIYIQDLYLHVFLRV